MRYEVVARFYSIAATPFGDLSIGYIGLRPISEGRAV